MSIRSNWSSPTSFSELPVRSGFEQVHRGQRARRVELGEDAVFEDILLSPRCIFGPHPSLCSQRWYIRIITSATLLLVASLSAQQPPTAQKPITAIQFDAPPPAPIPAFREEQQLWRAVATHDLTALRSLILLDFVYVSDKIENREQMLAGIGSCDPAHFNVIQPRAITATQDVAIITYRAGQDLGCGSGHKIGDVNVTSTWVNRDGQWLLQAHTETPSTVPLDPITEKFFNRQKK